MGYLPVIDSSNNGGSGTLLVYNVGTESATGITTSATSLTLLSSCSGALMPGNFCTITFSVVAADGNGNISVSYSTINSGSAITITTPVQWKLISAGPNLQVTFSPNPLNISGNTTINVVITNIGKTAITLPALATQLANMKVLSGSATYVSSNLACASSTLTPNQSCTNAFTYNAIKSLSTNYLQFIAAYTVSGESKSEYLFIPYTAIPPLTSITINPLNLKMGTGQSGQFQAIGNYSDATTSDLTNLVTWSSSNTSVATITESSGIVTGVNNGTSII